MKKFAKKHLAIAVFMMAFGGMTNMAHAETTIFRQDIAADKAVTQAGAAKVEFAPSPNELISGIQKEDVAAFVLKLSDSAMHSGWRLIGTGLSSGGAMFSDSGSPVPLSITGDWQWVPAGLIGYWQLDNSSDQEIETELTVDSGRNLEPGIYHFSARVEEFL
ncbi:MyfA/PsaA family fimbrial adhesin [Yersinia alsatica]|uniref:MyfA/PsaA family fimbrial adhesin n=1 Tax=Yersinia alsatica TaxID=2890317 RepID=UPI00119E1B1C|nr:MyfA/PsaA family fimbrial adhesin [Yersinia alsatica]